jgi:hypothetical protein
MSGNRVALSILQEQAECPVDRARIAKNRRHIRGKHHNVGSLGIALCVFASHAFAEIVLLKKVRSPRALSSLLHSLTASRQPRADDAYFLSALGKRHHQEAQATGLAKRNKTILFFGV